ncbi:MAG TPA: TauD/TfdA family dioxygenase [Actinophytocola sp.]|uniref:TauD/TfdA family dioxygenase n=1 Tax=Actinophytocola sp. TaxID=1872138 RepID=UPI002DDD63FA|nr:TauD/TfdA family dioxygenase [Actinophytocola sp.]HEV2783173.1 TauD/TfdA family dioxygenase [Actinophytocola sp.]
MLFDQFPRVLDASGAVTLTGAERNELDALANCLATTASREMDSVDWIRAARALSCEAPCRLRVILRHFRRDSGSDGFLLLHGLPVCEERLPATPVMAESVQRFSSHPASMLALVGLQLGELVAYREEKSGALVQDVVPVPGMESSQSNSGSTELELHVENAFHPNRPDFVCLLCLRPDHDRVAGLRIAACRRAVDRLTERTRRVLHQPRFVTTPPASFGDRVIAAIPHAILDGCPDDPDLRVDFASTQPSDEEAARAMIELRKALLDVQTTLVLEAGDLAVVDNRTAVHGRTAFRPRYDNGDRWLQRAYIHADIRRSRRVRPADGHVVHGM